MVDRRSFFIITIIVFIVDQCSKILVERSLLVGQSVLERGVFSFTRVHNTGVAWGMLQGKGFISILVSILVIGAIVYYFKDIFKSKWVLVAVALILAGALGNLVDRMVVEHVIDFIDFTFWPTFNIADSALVVGAAMLVFQNSFKSSK